MMRIHFKLPLQIRAGFEAFHVYISQLTLEFKSFQLNAGMMGSFLVKSKVFLPNSEYVLSTPYIQVDRLGLGAGKPLCIKL